VPAPIVNGGGKFRKWKDVQLKRSWPWPWIRSYWIPSCITHRHLHACQNFIDRKNFFWTNGRTHGRTDRAKFKVMWHKN